MHKLFYFLSFILFCLISCTSKYIKLTSGIEMNVKTNTVFIDSTSTIKRGDSIILKSGFINNIEFDLINKSEEYVNIYFNNDGPSYYNSESWTPFNVTQHTQNILITFFNEKFEKINVNYSLIQDSKGDEKEIQSTRHSITEPLSEYEYKKLLNENGLDSSKCDLLNYKFILLKKTFSPHETKTFTTKIQLPNYGSSLNWNYILDTNISKIKYLKISVLQNFNWYKKKLKFVQFKDELSYKNYHGYIESSFINVKLI